MRILRSILIFIPCFILGLILHGWSALALYYCIFSAQSGLRPIPSILYLLAVLLFIILRRKHTQAFFMSLLGFVLVSAWFSSIQPKKGGIYPPELTLPYAEIKDDTVTFHNVRNCSYRTKDDFDVRYETRIYDLNKLKTLDIMVNYWGMDAIAHTFLAFGFSDGQYLDVSVEIRPEVGKAYDMLQGFFKQYQLIYIWADERDLIALRTNYKKENVYLYRSTLSPEDVRKLFLSMLESTSAMIEAPQFYNTLTHSCTNTLGNHLKATKIINLPFWKRKFLTGDVDQRLYKEGLLTTYGLPFSELRQKANIDSRAQQANRDNDFSEKVRTHLHP
jgi:hypothetical protein